MNAENSGINPVGNNGINEADAVAEVGPDTEIQRQLLKQRCWNDAEAFFRACIAVDTAGRKPSGGIGTLSEKKMHSVIKHFIEPDASKHEIGVGGSIADVKNECGIFEVQTASFNILRKKLPQMLESSCVTVVYPIPFEKRIIKIDALTGEAAKPRKSPKHGSFFDSFFELYKLADVIENNNLNILLLLIDADEYRIENMPVKKRGRRRRSTAERLERIPIALRGAVLICERGDWQRLLPAELGAEFTSADLAKLARIHTETAQTALRVLSRVGAVCCLGKRGRLKLYASAKAFEECKFEE